MPKDIFQIKVTLTYSNPPIWRRLLVHRDTSLDDLHDILQIAFDWNNSHLHHFFKDRGKERYEPGFNLEQEWGSTALPYDNLTVGDFLKRKNSKFYYEYDFGDSWLHEIVLEDRLQEADDLRVPFCLNGERAAPPEDSGGVPGYQMMLEVLKDRKHPEYHFYRTWMPKKFNPERFELGPINDTLEETTWSGPAEDNLLGEMGSLFDLMPQTEEEDELLVNINRINELVRRQLDNEDPPEVSFHYARLSQLGFEEPAIVMMFMDTLSHHANEDGDDIRSVEDYTAELAFLPLACLEKLFDPIINFVAEHAEMLEADPDEDSDEFFMLMEEIDTLLHFLAMGTGYSFVIGKARFGLLATGVTEEEASLHLNSEILSYLSEVLERDEVFTHRKFMDFLNGIGTMPPGSPTPLNYN